MKKLIILILSLSSIFIFCACEPKEIPPELAKPTVLSTGDTVYRGEDYNQDDLVYRGEKYEFFRLDKDSL